MKLAIVTVFVLALSLGSAFQLRSFPATYGIKEDIQDFIDLIPREKVLNIVISYLADDEEVQETLHYILSDDFKDIILSLEAIPEFREFLAYLQSNGLNVYYYVNKIHSLLGLGEYQPELFLAGSRKEPGVRGMLNAIEAILPVKQLQDMFDDKLTNSPAFASLIANMRSDDFKVIVSQMNANQDFQELIERAKGHGIDVALIQEILNRIFGW